MSRWYEMSAAVDVEIFSADIASAMTAMAKAGIFLENVTALDAFRMRFLISRRQLRHLQRLAQRRGDSLQILGQKGMVCFLQALWHRKVLLFGLLGIFLLSLWVPSHVLFVQVEGNSAVPQQQIVEAAARCGLCFGASRREIRSERLKNALLSAIPDLQWAGVNTYGCRAVITVRERQKSFSLPQSSGVSSVVAAHDGVIRQMTVQKGNALCSLGQVVKAGEVLVSGYQDVGIFIRAGEASAEIYADTRRLLRAVYPTQYTKRDVLAASGKKYSLIIGKKRINFSKDSGIYGMSCAKIYKESYLTLPGGFQLPIALCCEQWYDYQVQPICTTDAEERLSAFAAAYVPQQMLAGQIRQADEVLSHHEGYDLLQGVYGCYEMISITRPEERLHE